VSAAGSLGGDIYSNRWARHYQDAWEARSGDPKLPGWLRVASYAYAKHGANGHAPLTRASRHGPGTLQIALATIHPETREMLLPPRQRVHEWVRQAVEFGWLDGQSSTVCLIVPAQAVEGGLGNPRTPCKTCSRGSRATRGTA